MIRYISTLLLALTLSVSLSQDYLPLFQSARSAFLLTGALLTVLAFYQILRNDGRGYFLA